jgi:hypothetical protein
MGEETKDKMSKNVVVEEKSCEKLYYKTTGNDSQSLPLFDVV